MIIVLVIFMAMVALGFYGMYYDNSVRDDLLKEILEEMKKNK
jgi:hypothetical protein